MTAKGFASPEIPFNQFNSMKFVVERLLNKVQTTTICKVLKCTNSGGVSPIGYVNVQPMVNMVDSSGQAVAYPILYNVPYMRIQGGANAVILDPKAGDIGILSFASRDISKVKNSKVQNNPDSERTFDLADGLYLGGILNAAPSQYVRFSDSGIELVSPTKVTITSPSMVLNGAVTLNGGMTATGDVTASGISLATHKHGGVMSGPSQTSPPV